MMLFSVLLVACGLPGQKPLSDLDEKDWEQLCDEYDEDVSESCEIDGVTYDVEIGGSSCDPGESVDLYAGCEDHVVDDMRDCMDAGMDDYAVKPLNQETLTEVLSRNLPTSLLVPPAPGTPGGTPSRGLHKVVLEFAAE